MARLTLVEAMIRATDLSADALHDRARIEAAQQHIIDYVELKNPDLLPLIFEIQDDTEHSGFSVRIGTRAGGRSKRTALDYDLMKGSDVAQLRAIHEGVTALGKPPFYAVSTKGEGDEDDVPAESRDEIGDIDALVAWIDARGRKGLSIQRYKGLGEMNPEQLWETTMNPETRVLKQVKIDDAVETDQLFSLLMGDEVEPRREFIERHALEVKELDI